MNEFDLQFTTDSRLLEAAKWSLRSNLQKSIYPIKSKVPLKKWGQINLVLNRNLPHSSGINSLGKG